METARARAVVTGRVQGVWFRASTRDMAQGLGLSGWVRNLPNGDVEAEFEGPRSAVEEALSWCRRGPQAARVDGCDVAWVAPQGSAPPFEIRYA